MQNVIFLFVLLLCIDHYAAVYYAINKTVTLNTTNTHTDGAVITTFKNTIIDNTTNEWKISVPTDDHNGFHLAIDLDNTWSFYPNATSIITLRINGTSSLNFGDKDMLISFSVNNSVYFTVYIRLDFQSPHRIYPECGNDLAIGNVKTLVAADSSFGTTDRECKALGGICNHYTFVYGYPWDKNNVNDNEKNYWPLIIQLTNDAITNDMYVTLTNPNWQLHSYKLQCSFSSAFPTDYPIQIYFGIDDPGESVELSSFTISHTYYTTYNPNLISLNPTIAPTTAPTTNTPTTTAPTTFFPTDTPTTVAPTTNTPTTFSPTNTPTKYPTPDSIWIFYGVTITISFQYDLNNASANVSLSHIKALLANITAVILSNEINDIDICTDSDEYNISIIQKHVTTITATIVVCDQNDQTTLVAQLNQNLQTEFIDSINQRNILLIDETSIQLDVDTIFGAVFPDQNMTQNTLQEDSKEDKNSNKESNGLILTLFIVCSVLLLIIVSIVFGYKKYRLKKKRLSKRNSDMIGNGLEVPPDSPGASPTLVGATHTKTISDIFGEMDDGKSTEIVSYYHAKIIDEGMNTKNIIIDEDDYDMEHENESEAMDKSNEMDMDSKHELDPEQKMDNYTAGFTELKINETDRYEIKQWLDIVDLPQYYFNFIDNGYDAMSFIKEIKSMTELDDIGIVTQKHQMKIISEIQTLWGYDIKQSETITGNDNVMNKKNDHINITKGNDDIVTKGNDDTKTKGNIEDKGNDIETKGNKTVM